MTTQTQPRVDDAVNDPIAEKFTKQERLLREWENKIKLLRAFFVEHREAISPFEWTAYAWDDGVTFRTFSAFNDNEPKAIARALGAEGWKREHSPHTCGAVDWTKTIDGVLVRIEAAEQIKPKLIEEVKLP